MLWIWITSGILLTIIGLLGIGWVALFYYVKARFYPVVPRILQEKPLFVIPRGDPVDEAEDVDLRTEDGLTLRGCYLPTTQETRAGVILFGLEFGSTRWACVPYTQFLRDAGYDIFTFEPRNVGDSDHQPGYEPLPWVTTSEVRDMLSAVAYLKSRPDADPRGVGFFGFSKGAAAGLMAAAEDDCIRCCVTDGVFGMYTTMLPYMRKWIMIYAPRRRLTELFPTWYFAIFARMAVRQVEREQNCKYANLEPAMPKLAPRPLLMIHGKADNYIKPEMGQQLFELAREPKEFWLVKKAKHNQAFQIATEEYQQRVLQFFQTHLGRRATPHLAMTNGPCAGPKGQAPVSAAQS